MADDEYNKKLESLQQYIPFLDGMIAQLKDPSKKNREQQLSKMESLHAMITDRRKKLKLETLHKCEDVISKLYLKVNHKPINHLKAGPATSSPRSTPVSPSPPRHRTPLAIPTERLTPVRHPRIDVYSSAAESLNKPRPQHVSPKFPDISKPPISLADLKDLEEDVHLKINERASLHELNNIRNKIAHELILENIKSLSPSKPHRSRNAETTRTKSRISFSEGFVENDLNFNDSRLPTVSPLELCSPIQLHIKNRNSPTVSKERSSIFGGLISSQIHTNFQAIDNINEGDISRIDSQASEDKIKKGELFNIDSQVLDDAKKKDEISIVLEDTKKNEGTSGTDSQVLEDKKKEVIFTVDTQILQNKNNEIDSASKAIEDPKRKIDVSSNESHTLQETKGDVFNLVMHILENKKKEVAASSQALADKEAKAETSCIETQIPEDKSKKTELEISDKVSGDDKKKEVKRRSSLTKEDTIVTPESKSDKPAQVLETKDKEHQRRTSITKDEKTTAKDKSKERRHSKDYKRSDSKKEKSKEKDHDSSGKKGHEGKHSGGDKSEGKDSTTTKDEKSKSKDKDEKKRRSSSSSHKHSKSEHKKDSKDKKEEKEDVIVQEAKPELKEPPKPTEVVENKEPAPVYSRLADKYRKKPKKTIDDVVDVDKAVSESIEANMIISPPKIPIINRLTEPPPPPPASLVKCSRAEPELLPSILQTLMDQLRKSHQEPRPSNPLLQQPKPVPSPNLPLLQNRPLLQSPPIIPSNPPLLLSPTDNFVSEYVREEYGNAQNQTWPDRARFDTAGVPATNRYVPTIVNQRFETTIVNQRFDAALVNQRFDPAPANQRFDPAPVNRRFDPRLEAMQQLDYYPPNSAASVNQFNGGPPLLSPETPHYYEPKPNAFVPNSRDQFLQSEDLRWRLDDNRPPWERRDYEPRYRGPATYREYREMRDNIRDPRVARENRDPREVNRDPRNIRDVRDPRTAKDPRLNRDSSKDNSDAIENDVRDPRTKKEFERGRPRNREDYRSNKFESKFDRMYSRTNRDRSRSRSRSSGRSRSNTQDKDSFVSPLNSLYTGKEQKVGKGYGVQSFRIPKLKKEVDDKLNLKTEQNAETTVGKEEGDDEHDEPIVISNEHHDTKQELDESSESKGNKTEAIDSTDKDDSSVKIEETDKHSITEENDDMELNSTGSEDNEETVSAPTKEILEDKTEKSELKIPCDGPEIKIALDEKSETKIPHDEKPEITTPQEEKCETSTIPDDKSSSELVPITEHPKSVELAPEEPSPEEPSPKEPIITKSEHEELNVQTEEPEHQTTEELNPKEPETDLPPTLFPEESMPEEPKVLETKPPTEQTILAQFFANLLNSQDKKEKKTALYSLISTFSDSFSSKELSKITKIIKADDTDGSSEEEGEAPKKQEAIVTPEKVVEEPTREPEPEQPVEESCLSEEFPKRKLRRRIRRISSGSPVKYAEEIEDEEPKSCSTPVQEHDLSKSDNSFPLEEPVIVSVGERIKSRKRNSSANKPKKKNRSELDRLHEDIQDMFIRDGVLTATGKRMCHLLKGDPSALEATSPSSSKESVEIVPQRRKPGPKSKQQKYLESLQNKEMRDMSIVIQKISYRAMEESGKNVRRLTRSMTNGDSDSEDDNTLGGEESGKEYSDRDDSESSESERETAPQIHEEGHKPRIQKRKRGRKGWASGIIKKIKKKKPPAEEPVAHVGEKETAALESKDFLEPDINYYVDFATERFHCCKLCNFRGKFIATHYKSVHPDSEVLCSRFTPALAEEAIADAKKNLSKYENCMATRGSQKLKYSCRFCTNSYVMPPTFFYDHISTHTGEYRHICPNCNVSFCNGKTLLFHIKTHHAEDKKTIVRKAYNTTIMFGYLCGECNYVQINRKSVEEHVNIYHLVKPTIHKINLSTYFDDEIENLGRSEPASEPTENSELPEERKPKETLAVDVPVRSKPKPASVKRREAEAKKKAEEAKSAPEPPVVEEPTVPMIPPKVKKRGPKPGPRSKKKLLVVVSEPESDTATDIESVSSKGRDDESDKEIDKVRVRKRRGNGIDTGKILPGKSRRSAKDKAQEKLKVLMEMNETPQKRKSSIGEDKTEEMKRSTEKETSTTKDDTVEDKESTDDPKGEEGAAERREEPVKVIEKQEKTKAVKVEMNIFTCNTDLQEENRKIEQERLEKMDELNKSVGSRTSLNFVDKLCDRLSNNIRVKQELSDDLTESMFGPERSKSPLTMPVLEKNPPTSVDKEVEEPRQLVIKKANSPPPASPPPPPPPAPPTPPPLPPAVKKPVLQEDPEPARPSFEVTQKNDKSIVDMIEKLKGKLAPVNVDDERPPPLTNVNELVNVKSLDSSAKLLEIGGLVKLIKTDTTTTYCCLIPPCVFSTDDSGLFQSHYADRHAAMTFERDNTLCETCGIQIEADTKGSLLVNLFKHTIAEHTDFNDAGAKKPQSIRIRKLSGDALSIVKKDWEEEIDSSLISKEGEAKEAEPQTDKAAKVDKGGAENEKEVAPVSMAEIELDDNPFPFKISGVMSLAEPPPPLAPIAKQSVQLVVKEAKLTTAELAKPKKTQKALAKFIEEVSNLYKCPHYYCLFTTNFRDFLEKHLKAHNVEPNSMIPCVYCDMKTPWEHVAMHIDIRHANCRFACSYCLYRAAVKEYVFLHQDRAHPANDYSVIALPTPKIHKKFSAVDVKVDPKSLCEPYKCAVYCQMEFLFENEFRKHLMDFHNHSTFMTCGHDNCTFRVLTSKLLAHWSSAHSVSSYQCGYCKTSHNDVKMMYHHFSGSHQNLSPDILIRLVNPLPSNTLVLGYSAEAFRRMRRIVAIPNTFTDDKNAPAPATEPSANHKPAPSVTPFTKTTLQVVNPGPPNNSNFTLVTSASSATSSGSILLFASDSNVKTAPLPVPALAPRIPTPTFKIVAAAPPNQLPSPPAVAPVEHITLRAEVSHDEPAEPGADPLDLGDPPKETSAAEGASGGSSEEESDRPGKTKLALLGYQLYRCAFCDFSCSNSNDFKKHCSRSMACRKLNSAARPFECVHCAKCLKSAQALVEHMQSHGVLRYSCSLCMSKFATPLQAKSHLKYRHNVNQTFVTPLNPLKTNGDTDEFIVKPKIIQSSQPPKEAAPSEAAAASGAEEDVYTPDQIANIPIRSIFSSYKKCGICSYSTKVRTNLLRHLLFHSQEKAVSDTAPVNPVPCLEKNEKMFDKMVNLAGSSHTGGGSRMGGNAKQEGKEPDNLPEFVSTQYRYACCAQGCSYICPEESNLRHHVMALHGDDTTTFACFHCKADIVPSDVDGLMKHLKLHGLHLCKCHYCSFVHHQKSKVEKHINDAHLDVAVRIVVVRNMAAEPTTDHEESPTAALQTTPQPAPAKTNGKPWRCCMCKTRSATCDGIRGHVLDKHEVDAQYKCAICAYMTDHEATFEGHFRDAHAGQDVDYISAYRKIEEEVPEEGGGGGDAFDTTPLWQRDRPRVRHIRGILFDESSPTPAKQTKKTPTKAITPSSSKSSSSSLDFSIDAVAKGTAGVLNDDELIEQVNKIMKNSKDIVAKVKETDVIVIDDDEDSPAKPKTGVKRKSIEVSGITKIPRMDDIIDLDISEDDDACSEKNLKLVYGQFGQPLNRQLRCPLCNNFKSKRMSDFIYHMFKEKKVYRFKCAICADESITYRYMSRHVKEHKPHTDFRDNIIVLPPNPKLEVWVQMLIGHQCAKILPSLTPIQEALVEAAKKVECRYCQKWFKSEQEKNEHAIYHWRNVPFACDTCDFRGYTRHQIERHFERMHTSFTLNVLEKGPTVAAEIDYTDRVHMNEALQEEEQKQLKVVEVKEASVAEIAVPVPVPEVRLHDKSPQDGAVNGTGAENSNDSYEPPDDLVIVTKTDTNVPNEADVFCCEYCPYMSNSETLIMSHISGRHEHMHIKFRLLNRQTCEDKREDFVGCALCPQIGSEISIRRHHLEKHDGQTFLTYRYTCNICQKRFMKIAGLKNHSVRTHPSIPVMYTGLFNNVVNLDYQKPARGRTTSSRATPDRALAAAASAGGRPTNKGSDVLTYECPLCPYKKTMQRKQKANVRLHVKQHFKSFYCGECPQRFMNNLQAISHYNDKHPGLPKNVNHDPGMDEQCLEVFNLIQASAQLADAPPRAAPPRAAPPAKRVAKKSTSSPHRPPPSDEYSYYGAPGERVDLTRIMTSVDINGVCLDMSADKLGQIFDLNPHVRVEDCRAADEPESAAES